MKRLGIVIIFCLVSVGCRKFDIEPMPPKVEDIFSVKEVQVSDGQNIKFNLQTDGIYTLTLMDSTTEQVLMREKIAGKIGQNTFNIYTKSLPVRYLYLSLEDINNVQIGKTLLILN